MHHCVKKWLTAVAAIFVVALLSFPASLPAADRVRFALSANSMGYLPLRAAIHRGFFKDEAIDIEVVQLLPNIAHTALLSGEIHYHGLADTALGLAARDAPLKAIFYAADKPMYFMLARKEIHSVAELKGKKIGISRFGGTTDLSARLILRNAGIQPDRDAAIVQMGFEPDNVASLRAGATDAIVVPVPASVLLKREGYNELAFVGDVVQFASNGYTTTDGRIKERPQEVKRVVRALYRGLRFAKENPEGTIAVIQKEWKVDPDVARESYKSIIKALNDDGIIGEKQLNVHFDIIRQANREIGEIPVEKVVDFRLLREVRRELSGK